MPLSLFLFVVDNLHANGEVVESIESARFTLRVAKATAMSSNAASATQLTYEPRNMPKGVTSFGMQFAPLNSLLLLLCDGDGDDDEVSLAAEHMIFVISITLAAAEPGEPWESPRQDSISMNDEKEADVGVDDGQWKAVEGFQTKEVGRPLAFSSIVALERARRWARRFLPPFSGGPAGLNLHSSALRALSNWQAQPQRLLCVERRF